MAINWQDWLDADPSETGPRKNRSGDIQRLLPRPKTDDIVSEGERGGEGAEVGGALPTDEADRGPRARGTVRGGAGGATGGADVRCVGGAWHGEVVTIPTECTEGDVIRVDGVVYLLATWAHRDFAGRIVGTQLRLFADPEHQQRLRRPVV
jgi:hypothetical protein